LWLYGNWVYIYICKKCLSALTLWVRITIMRGNKTWQWLGTGWWFLRFPPPKKWPPRYNWHIFESGAIHHKSQPWIRSRILSVNRFHSKLLYVLRDNHRSSNVSIIFLCGLLMNLFLLSTRFVKSTGMHSSHLHWFLATRLVGNVTRVKCTFKTLVLAPLKTVRGTKWVIFIEDTP